ncbi:MAG: hypothetical protein IKI97_03795 [Clostridia bacterium]|nr:hypothetical protein [Clostridia bacterium]
MKKYIIALLVATSIFALCSCGDTGRNNGDTITNDINRAANDMGNSVDRFANDMTDDTVFDTDNNYNVDRYQANGDETR